MFVSMLTVSKMLRLVVEIWQTIGVRATSLSWTNHARVAAIWHLLMCVCRVRAIGGYSHLYVWLQRDVLVVLTAPVRSIWPALHRSQATFCLQRCALQSLTTRCRLLLSLFRRDSRSRQFWRGGPVLFRCGAAWLRLQLSRLIVIAFVCKGISVHGLFFELHQIRRHFTSLDDSRSICYLEASFIRKENVLTFAQSART